MQKTEYGIRLNDVRFEEGWTITVPARSIDHAEEIVRWHNDPQNESCYEAALVQRQITITNWELVPRARNVIP